MDSADLAAPTPALLEKFAAMTVAEQRAEAERSRGDLVRLWRERAQPEKKGKAFRGVLPYECMQALPGLLQARLKDPKIKRRDAKCLAPACRSGCRYASSNHCCGFRIETRYPC